MRRLLIVSHRWVALIVGLVLLITSASGAVLVFENAIDRALNPSLWHVTPSAAPLSIDTLAARVHAQLPGAPPASVNLSEEPDRAWTMSAGSLTVFVNPYTGSVNGTRTAAQSRETLARRLHVLHVELFAGKLGRSIVGVVDAIALFLVITGLFLWWPDKLLRINTRASWKRINFDLHHVIGVLAAIVLIVITASGLLVHYEGLSALVLTLDSTAPAAMIAQPANPTPTGPPSFDAMAAVARTALPGATVMFIALADDKRPVTVAMRFPEDHTPAGRSRVFINRWNGAVLNTIDTRKAGVGTRIDNLKRSLHTGDVLGKPTATLWFLATLAMLSQIVSGVLMWWNARRGRKKK
ncbi:MAG: PepSY-associated TM helix domain-containing protein [Gemmatimonadaceae bacterium]